MSKEYLEEEGEEDTIYFHLMSQSKATVILQEERRRQGKSINKTCLLRSMNEEATFVLILLPLNLLLLLMLVKCVIRSR